MNGRGIFLTTCIKNKAEDKQAAHVHESISVIMTTCLYAKYQDWVPKRTLLFTAHNAAQGCCRFPFGCFFVFVQLGGEKMITKICAGNRKTKQTYKKSKCRMIHGAESGNCLREVAQKIHGARPELAKRLKWRFATDDSLRFIWSPLGSHFTCTGPSHQR